MVVVSSTGPGVTIVVAEAFAARVTVIWGGMVYPRYSVHHMKRLSWRISELARDNGSVNVELDIGVVLGLESNVVFKLGTNATLEFDVDVLLALVEE